MKSVCTNKWCKAHFIQDESNPQSQCPKCISFDQELSGGVSWENKHYEGPRWDSQPHQMKIKVNMYRQ